MGTLTLKKPSQRATEQIQKILRTKRLLQAREFIRSFPLFKDKIPKPVNIDIHKVLNQLRKKEKHTFGSQHLVNELNKILSKKAYKKQIIKNTKRYNLFGE